MSVDERTAAARRARAFRLANWVLIVPALSFFSSSAALGAISFKGKPDYAATIHEAKSLDVREAVVEVTHKVRRAF